MFFFNPKMKWKDGLISYYKTSGIICLKKHANALCMQVGRPFKKFDFFGKGNQPCNERKF
jgi:hypothetical protein